MVDWGEMVADDAWHARALQQAPSAGEGWVVTWPVLAEACHLLGKRLGTPFVISLMQDLAQGALRIWNPEPEHQARIPLLMRKYAGLPMDLADASLLLLGEQLGHGRILSTDQRDFAAYRWKSRNPVHNLLEAP